MALDRRTFIQLLSSGALAASIPESIAKALAIPANNKTGTIADVEHIVFMMQENRSFDHYFGTLNGVRGYGDPRAANLTTGKSVFYQPNGTLGDTLPFHPSAQNLGLQFLEDLGHDWTSTHQAWNQGNFDQWVPAKTYVTMAHLQRADIPYHYALADAFTICDAYHCSVLGPTDPNRYHMFSGWVGNDGKGGGPVVDNSEAGYSWSTFPEVLEAGGISWKVYQDIGKGLTASEHWGDTTDAYIGNYGDNSLLYFLQYQNAVPGSALYDNARTGTDADTSGTVFDQFRQDAAAGTLPQVSWVVAPEAYSEHPNWPANYGAYYVSEILDALTANPDVWSKTVLFIVYDENDGFFDHVVPPTPPQSAAQGLSNVSIANEIYPGSSQYASGPYGLGVRVPMLVVSPWSKGGWVDSEIFDHTSLIRFVERRFGTTKAPLAEPNITAWRKAVCGDLTSTFNFANPNVAPVTLPTTQGYIPPDNHRHVSYVPLKPLTQALPVQESGTRPARAVPYVLNVDAEVTLSTGQVALTFINGAARAGVFQVRSNNTLQPPRGYTVAGNTSLTDIWPTAALGLDAYNLSVYAANGLFRAFQGGLANTSANIHAALAYEFAAGGVTLTCTNKGAAVCQVMVKNVYASTTVTKAVAVGAVFAHFYPLQASSGWYDLLITVVQDSAFRLELAGHLESGKDSTTDPAIPISS